ncbi:DUF1206 domain-containing protein [Streptomyces sp. H10-C2]|uniref:DUF1206 domain-containing protein n=1 Tax=unclassified Streptomyces TaxID=2593676 RepID=UPI0024B96C43|nr:MULTISPECIES: DUF1206 domain-containing protein [unclassified Streptomyces]MDJ0346049.1 DUF1206 domain-containing protein [Streptomyces sp. PH10-H1]MDJ0372977.1 DUF1206 domain-containing protein [Streptomyces sp. H10-C2]
MGRAAAGSRAVEWAARWGLATRGVIYLLIGALAIQVAAGRNGNQADRGGAVEQISGEPFGKVMVWVVGLGLAGMALWRLSEALFGAAGPGGHKGTKRLTSAGRFVFYGLAAFSVIAFALSRTAGQGASQGGSSDKQSKDVTAKVLDMPYGQWLVGIAGVTLVAAGLWTAVRAAQRAFRKHLKVSEMSRQNREVVDFLGIAGGICRGVVFATAGGFAVAAAVKYDPNQAKGLDDTLRSFRETPAGPWLLVAIALGLALFGAFSFAMARWRKL